MFLDLQLQNIFFFKKNQNFTVHFANLAIKLSCKHHAIMKTRRYDNDNGQYRDNDHDNDKSSTLNSGTIRYSV